MPGKQINLPVQAGGFDQIGGMIDYGFAYLNTSRIFFGIVMLMLNLGGRYFSLELSSIHEEFLSNVWVRRFVAFAIFFMATHDAKLSLFLTIIFVIIVSGLLNEDSKYSLLPAKEKRKISKDEFLVAQRIVERFQRQES